MADANPQKDPLIEQSEQADAATQARFADLFDLRRVIGALLLLYGVILTVLGIFASDADIERAAGTNANLWTGIALLAAGAIFFAWALARPVGRQLIAEGSEDDGDPPAAAAERPAGGDDASGARAAR